MTKCEYLDQLESLARSATHNIESLQDFHVFTGYSYDRYSKMVDAGHIKESIFNVRTSTDVSETDLSKKLLAYLDNDLPRVALYQVVSHYEDFFFAFIRILLIINPNGFSQKRQAKVKEILECSNYDELEFLALREILDLQRKSLLELFDFLKALVDLNVTTDEIARLAELKATRDVHIHNGGIANEIYLRKAGTLARVSIGQHLTLSRSYVYDGADFLKNFIARIVGLTLARLSNA